MSLRINDTIPNLTVDTDQGSFALHDWIGDSWAILFSHPQGLHSCLHHGVWRGRTIGRRMGQARHQGNRRIRGRGRGSQEMEERY